MTSTKGTGKYCWSGKLMDIKQNEQNTTKQNKQNQTHYIGLLVIVQKSGVELSLLLSVGLYMDACFALS